MAGFVDVTKVSDPKALRIYCKVNGETRQNASAGEMIFDIPTLLEYITKYVTLERGDLVLTGSPEGTGQCVSGDELEIGIEGLGISAKFSVH